MRVLERRRFICSIWTLISLILHPPSVLASELPVDVDGRILASEDVGDDLGESQIVRPHTEIGQEILVKIREARDYVVNVVHKERSLEIVRPLCINHDPRCGLWSVRGRCEEDPTFMDEYCAPMCHTCHMLHVETRCPFDPSATMALAPGDLHRIFENLVTSDEFVEFQPTVLSRPEYATGDTRDSASYVIGPWVVQLENLVSPSEAARIVELGHDLGYEPSEVYGKRGPDGRNNVKEKNLSTKRTSGTAWCDFRCNDDDQVMDVRARIANVTGISVRHSEDLQLLRYEEGQYYQAHHDMITNHLKMLYGPRVLTVFLYLSDVEEGGGTHFPHLNLTVTPKLGRAVIWPSVLNSDPFQADMRTMHEALPVIKGVKYAANAWLHQGDYMQAMLNDCT